jgi:hypothetical protein
VSFSANVLILTEADTVLALDPKLLPIVQKLEAGFIDYFEGRQVGFYDIVVESRVYRVAKEHGTGTEGELH